MNRKAKSLQGKAKKHVVTPAGNGHFAVESASSGNAYTVRDLGGNYFRCNCEWAAYHPMQDCSHTLAVRDWLAHAANKSLSFWSNADDASRQHRPTENIGFGLWATERKAGR